MGVRLIDGGTAGAARRRAMSPASLAEAGIGEGAVRLSLEVEHVDDRAADLGQALQAA